MRARVGELAQKSGLSCKSVSFDFSVNSLLGGENRSGGRVMMFRATPYVSRVLIVTSSGQSGCWGERCKYQSHQEGVLRVCCAQCCGFASTRE